MPIQVPVVQTGLEQSIQQAAAKAGKNLRINMGPGAKSIESLSKPLGRLTGKADEFTKSMEAANARVLAFGASVGVIAAVSRSLQELVKTTIEVEKSLANINSILRQTESQLDSFKNQIFDIARNTGQTFDTVAEAALELSRQGLKAEEVTKRLNDALVLSRLSGLSAADSVAGLTAAVNSFSSAGLTTTEVLNKISAAAASAAVSDRDLIEGLKRSGAVAVASGVQFDELIGIISALQERTARGGAVIGNSLKTIFTRIQDIEKLNALQDLGVQVTDLSGQVLSSNKIIENLAPTFAKLDQASKVNLADNLVGKFQIAPFLALLEDYNLKVSRSGEVAATSFNATNEAYQRNEALSKTLADAVNVATVNLKELANTLGEIGVTDSLKNIIGVFNSVVSSIQDVLDGDGIGSQFAKGLIKGISAIISGPGLALALVAIGKLLLDFAKFGAGALKTFFGLNKAAEAQKNLQGQIAASLLNDKGIRSAILSIEKQNISEGEKKKLQTQFFTKALNEQLMVMQKMQGIARTIAPGVMAGTASRRGKRAAGGFLPIGAESSDISRGVGGAPASAKPVVIPNFAFGGGKRGTMVANDSEYIVPNYANGGDAIFNQNMVSSMGLPANARKVRAASGYIPNFAKQTDFAKARLRKIEDARTAVLNNDGQKFVMLAGDRGGDEPDKYMETKVGNRQVSVIVPSYRIKPGQTDKTPRDTAFIVKKLKDASLSVALDFARSVTGKKNVPEGVTERMKALMNDSKVSTTAGHVFEAGISGVLSSKEFLDYASRTSGSRVDMPYSPTLYEKFGVKKGQGLLGSEVKSNFLGQASAASKFAEVLLGKDVVAEYRQGSKMSETINKSNFDKFGLTKQQFGELKKFTFTGSATQKLLTRADLNNYQSFLQRQSQGLNFASGYIPNFADPLQDAVNRERSAGLPISQIRINQSGKLRNTQNPMGLAVTNTRDEPTGAIPNFAEPWNKGVSKTQVKDAGFEYTKKGVDAFRKSLEDATKETDKSKNAQSNSLGIIFGVQAGLTALSAATSDAENGVGKFVSMLSGSLSSISSFAFAGQAASQLGDSLKQSGGKFKGALGGAIGKLGLYGAALGAGFEVFKFGAELFDEYSGANKRSAEALVKLKDSADKLALGFTNLSELQKFEIQNEAESAINRRGPSEFGVLKREGDPDQVKDGKVTRKLIERTFGEKTFGDDKEIKKGFQETAAAFISLGKSSYDVDKILDNYKSTLTGAELVDFRNKFVEFRDTIDLTNKNFKKFAEGLTIEELEILSSTKWADYTKQLDIFLKAPKGSRFGTLPENLRRATVSDVKGEKVLKKDRDVREVEQINFRSVQNQIKTRLEIFKIQQKSRSEAEKELLLGEKLNTLTLQRKQELQNIIAGEQEIEVLNSKVSEGLVEQISNIKGITSEKLKSLELDNKINAALKDGKLTSEEALKILDDTADSLAAGGQNIGAQKTALQEYLKDLYERFDVEKDVNATLREGEQDIERQTVAQRKLNAEVERMANRDLKASQRASAENIAGIDKEIASIRMGQSGRSIVEARQENLRIADLEFSKVKIQNQRRLENAQEAQAKIKREANLLPEDDEKRSDLLQRGRDLIKDAYSQNRIDLQNAQSRLDTAKSLVHFKDALTLATDAVTNLDPELEQLRMTEKTAGTFRGRKEAELRRKAIEASIKQGGTPEEILKRINQEPLTRSLQDRRELLKKDDLEISSEFKDNLIEASQQFRNNFISAFAEGIESTKSLKDALLNTADQFIKAMTQNFIQKWMDGAQSSSSGGGILGGLGKIFGFSDGGRVNGGSGSRDDVPAMLMGGEYVMNKQAVQRYGTGFMEALNSGSLRGYARGGQVRDEEGMFTTPGMNGAGAIVGGANLMSFATQTPAALGRDTITSSGAFLDAESGRMTMFGRRNNPQFQKVQDAKRQAFDLAIKEREAYAQAEAQKVSLGSMLASAAISTIASFGISKVLGGGDMAKLIGSSLGNVAGTAVTGAPASGGVFGAMATDPKAVSDFFDIFTGGEKVDLSGVGSGSGIKFSPKSASARPSGNSAPLLDLYEGARLGGKMTMLPKLAATGGLIPAAGGVDTVPAMLSGGEFVMNAAATRNIGAGNLQALNSGAGVDNTDLVSKLDELILATEASQSTGEINITVNGSNGTDTQTSGQDATDQQRQLSERIKVAVKQVIADEQRLGGQLRR